MDSKNEERGFWILGVAFFLLVGWWLASGAGKTQWVRLIDVFVYGPYLLFLAAQESSYVLSTIEKVFLTFLGATTISYNARNYLGF